MKPSWWLDAYAAMLRVPQRCNPKAGAASQMRPRDRKKAGRIYAMIRRAARCGDEAAHEST